MQNRIKELRLEKGLKQSEVAKSLGICTQSFGYYERGVNQPNPDMLCKIADLFEVSVDYLIGRNDDLKLTKSERAAGASARRRVDLLPIEDDLLFTFREIGKKYGESGQRAALSTLENLLKLK